MAKRLFDICFSLIGLVLLSPLFFVCIALVKVSSQGPVFYSHPRVGLNGRRFGCVKFRTMYQNADAILQPLLASNPSLMKEWSTYFKLKDDPRITPIGKFLRKSSIDELPQIWNVLKGDMSIVGPRPLTEHEVIHYVKDKAERILSLRPGLTSLWIVRGRNALSLDERIALEETYVMQRSFWYDLLLIAKTIRAIFSSRGAC